MTDNIDLFVADDFDRWLESCPVGDPPEGLRSRCHSTLSCIPRNSVTHQRSKLILNHTLRVSAAIAACLAIGVFCWNVSPVKSSLLAASIQTVEDAPAIHIVASITHSKLPGQSETVDLWMLKGVGASVTHTINGRMDWKVVDDLATRSGWKENSNEVNIEPSPSKANLFSSDSLFRRFMDLEFLVEHEKSAKAAGIPINVEKMQGGVRRVTIGPEFVSESYVGAELFGTRTLTVDIDSTRNRIRRFTRFRKAPADGPVVPLVPTHRIFIDKSSNLYGKTLTLEDIQSLTSKNAEDVTGKLIDYSSPNGDRTEERLFDYPDPAAVDRSVFMMNVPENARRITHDLLSNVRRDEKNCRILAQALERFRADHDDRIPTNWDWELASYVGDTYSTPEPYWLDDYKLDLISGDEIRKDASKPGTTGWRFFHNGERYSALSDPEATVIAEYRHAMGYVIQMFATGRIAVSNP